MMKRKDNPPTYLLISAALIAPLLSSISAVVIVLILDIINGRYPVLMVFQKGYIPFAIAALFTYLFIIPGVLLVNSFTKRVGPYLFAGLIQALGATLCGVNAGVALFFGVGTGLFAWILVEKVFGSRRAVAGQEERK